MHLQSGWWITYFFLELPVFRAHPVNLHFKALELVLFLEPTFQRTLTVLEQPPFPFAHVGSSDFLFNLIELSSCWALRLRWDAWTIGQRIEVVVLARRVIIHEVILIVVIRQLVLVQLVHRGIFKFHGCSVSRTVFPFPLVCFGLRTILVFLRSVLILTRL